MKGVDGKKDNKLYCENKTDSELILLACSFNVASHGFCVILFTQDTKPGACDDGSTSVCA